MKKLKRKAYSIVLFIVSVSLLVAMLSGCIGEHNYVLKEDIDNIERAEIANIKYSQSLDIEVLAELKTDEAQALAQELCALTCTSPAPPIEDIESISVIFYYNDKSYEIISIYSSRYMVNDKPKYYGHHVYDEEEFTELLRSAIND